jgi:hypothetical protein
MRRPRRCHGQFRGEPRHEGSGARGLGARHLSAIPRAGTGTMQHWAPTAPDGKSGMDAASRKLERSPNGARAGRGQREPVKAMALTGELAAKSRRAGSPRLAISDAGSSSER